ncbi:glycoside hydrolase family 15 protein [Pelomyxa schiedti]|nr:glycoside hydrolase family 15 protein [Pelomyxa schiedti]
MELFNERMEASYKELKVHLRDVSTGAIIASDAFDWYKYCWLRDGTFCAYALDVYSGGSCPEAKNFYFWVHSVILEYQHKFMALMAALHSRTDGHPIPPGMFPHTRFTVDGKEVPGEWGSFQIDGYGAFLWGAAYHAKSYLNDTTANMFISKIRTSLELVTTFLVNFWDEPCYDCWEEFGPPGQRVLHPSTLACVYAGLRDISVWVADTRIPKVLQRIEAFLNQRCIGHNARGPYFRKWVSADPSGPTRDQVDASLLWLQYPFNVVDPSHPAMQNTIAMIQSDLTVPNPAATNCWGVRRYQGDTYYGGGAWIILGLWLACIARDSRRAESTLLWAMSLMRMESNRCLLPEQEIRDETVFDVHAKNRWISEHGHPAPNLAWSHAMFLLLGKMFRETL